MFLDVDPMKVRYQPSMNAPDKFGTRPVWVTETVICWRTNQSAISAESGHPI
jgi:hypothetical protein